MFLYLWFRIFFWKSWVLLGFEQGVHLCFEFVLAYLPFLYWDVLLGFLILDCILGLEIKKIANILKTFCKLNYRVFDMDEVDSKELLWPHFGARHSIPIIFMVEKCVHFDIWNKEISKISLCFGLFFKFTAKSKFEKWAKSYRDPLKKWKQNIFQISNVHISHIHKNDKYLAPVNDRNG